MSQTRCLVIGSCTGDKDDEGCPEQIKLKEADFETDDTLSSAEKIAKEWLRPAGKMYIGTQHVLMMSGIERLRTSFSQATFDVAIVSAGYGLISEKRNIAPYNITFQKKGNPWIRERGRALKIPEMTRKLILQYQVVFFLLGEEYLTSLGTPFPPALGQKFIYFGNGVRYPFATDRDIIAIPASQPEARHYKGAGVTGLKGRLFDLLAKEICTHPERWRGLLVDKTSSTLLRILDDARMREIAIDQVNAVRRHVPNGR